MDNVELHSVLWIVPPADSGIEYIRISAFDFEELKTGKNMIITINEEI